MIRQHPILDRENKSNFFYYLKIASMMKKQLIATIVLLLICCSSLLAQVKRTITGVITDANGKPVPGATITVKGTTKAAVANDNGEYSIAVDGNPELVVSSVGFLAQTVQAKDGNTLSVSLNANNDALTEVVVTGFGVKKQTRKLAYSITE